MESQSPESQETQDDCRYFRTTCGLLGFILSFLMAFFCFIIADEAGDLYENAIIFGFIMLFIASLIFCFVMNESKRVYNAPTLPSDWMPIDSSAIQTQQLEVSQSEPEPGPSREVPQVPILHDRTIHDNKYVKCVRGLPSGDSDETLGSAIEHEYETIPLRRISRPGLDSDSRETTSESSNPYQDAESLRRPECEGAASDVQSYSPKPGPSGISGKGPKSIGSKSDDSILESISSLSTSASLEWAVEKKEFDKFAKKYIKLHFDASKKKAAKKVKHDSSSTQSEGISDKDDPPHDEDNSDKNKPSPTSTAQNPGCDLN